VIARDHDNRKADLRKHFFEQEKGLRFCTIGQVARYNDKIKRVSDPYEVIRDSLGNKPRSTDQPGL
jgi:hypothetical protein